MRIHLFRAKLFCFTLFLSFLIATDAAAGQAAQNGQVYKTEVQFDATSYAVSERAGSIEITVTRTGDLSKATAIGYATVKGTASDISDYIPSVGTLRFAPGETKKTFTVLIIQDKRTEGAETVRLVLSNPSGTSLGSVGAAVLTIDNDNAAASAANPIDETQFFVRQHYLDFLNREADAPGLAFWMDQINQCAGEPKCVEVRRINVSAAFFFSIEFHNTGYLVYRLHRTAFDTGEKLRLGDFLPDSQAIRHDLIVGQGNWEQQLADNKQAYLNDFVSRQAFLDKYPLTMSAGDYVDALNKNTGNSLSPTERDDLVGRLGSGAINRAQALLAIAEDPDFDRREMNRAFVLMEYFGYLRRNGDDLPDIDLTGYNFWLAKLNQFNGNFVRAEMVKAFLSSGEYLSRFGPQVISVSPGAVQQGQTITANITGQFTGFIKGVTRMKFGDSVSVGGASPGDFGPVTVIDRTNATAQLNVAGTATVGLRSVSVVTGSERVVLDNGFDVRAESGVPQITINPADKSTVNTKQPPIDITYSDDSGVDTSTLVIKLDGTDMTRFFVITPTKASCQFPLTGGQHVIDVSVKDTSGNEGKASSKFAVSVFQALPEVSPVSGVAPLTVTFVTKAEYTDGAIIRYRWDFQGDGTFDTNDPGARDYTRTFTQKGTFKALLEVTNDKDEKATATVNIVVSGGPPTATASINPSNGAVPLTVNFTGSGTDSDGTITKFEWDFDGDGTFDFSSPTTGNTTHVYNTAGAFSAVFRVTDNDGLTATARVTATAVRVGPAGSPTATITAPANPLTGTTPFTVNFNGTGTDADGTIAKYEWDFDGDGTFDFSSPTSAATSFKYESPGLYTAALRVTDNAGLTGTDTVDITVNTNVTLSLSTDTCKTGAGGTIEVNTTLGGRMPVTIFVRDKAGQTVRTLVNNVTRNAGSFKDTWDCKDTAGQAVTEGVYYAILQYNANGQTQTLDLTKTTGNQFFNPDWTMSTTGGASCFNCPFKPFEDNFLKVDFTLPRASEVTVSIRLFNRVDEVVGLFDRKPFGRGNYTAFWDGTDVNGNIVAPPPGETFLWGMTAFTLPNNAIFVENAPQLTAVSADPNYFDPATGNFISPDKPTTKVSYTLTKQANVTLQVFRTGTNTLMRNVTQTNVAAGTGIIEWDGRDNNDVFADKGTYRLALKATDAAGNQSIVRYVLVKVFY